jgi:hypothetical protein
MRCTALAVHTEPPRAATVPVRPAAIGAAKLDSHPLYCSHRYFEPCVEK